MDKGKIRCICPWCNVEVKKFRLTECPKCGTAFDAKLKPEYSSFSGFVNSLHPRYEAGDFDGWGTVVRAYEEDLM